MVNFLLSVESLQNVMKEFSLEIETKIKLNLKKDAELPNEDELFYHTTEVSEGTVKKIMNKEGLVPGKAKGGSEQVFLTNNLLFVLDMAALIPKDIEEIPKEMKSEFFILLVEEPKGLQTTKRGEHVISKVPPENIKGYLKSYVEIKNESKVPMEFATNYVTLIAFAIEKILSEQIKNILNLKKFDFEEKFKRMRKNGENLLKSYNELVKITA